MLRLTLVFLLWLASTAWSVEELEARRAREAERRALLAHAERDWQVYRQLTDTNVRTILAPDDGCRDDAQ